MCIAYRMNTVQILIALKCIFLGKRLCEPAFGLGADATAYRRFALQSRSITNKKQQAKPQGAQNAVHKLTCGETDFTPFMSKQSSNSLSEL